MSASFAGRFLLEIHINLTAASDHLSKVTGLSRGVRGVVFVEAFSFDHFKLGWRRVRQRASPSYSRFERLLN
jgi:hypothetical protein